MMNTKHFLIALLLLLSIGCNAFADRQLDRGEILQIFNKLTSQPRNTWISAGTIEATHEEYRAPKTSDIAQINREIAEQIQEYQGNPSKRELTEELQKMRLDAIPFNVRSRLSNKYTMNSNVEVRYDGDRFYWEINVSSRTDSVRPDTSLADNFMTDQFDLDLNARRVFAWDGQKYTIYFSSSNHALVDTTGGTPQAVNGPLTAGIIPWGYGDYTYANLSAAETSAEEKNVNNQTQIHMTITNADGTEMVFVLDPGKDYAVISSTMNGTDTVVSSQYGNYQLVSGNWVPSNISIDQYDARNNRLLAYDIWNLSTISGKTPSPGSFDVYFEADALIEYDSDLTSKPAMYTYSYTVDTDLLLLERLAYAASEGTQRQNCATAALKYTITQLGKDVTDRQLGQLVSRPDETTSLYAMKQFVQSQGLYCRAVQLDINSLRKLQGCEVILHIPGKNHFIVLGDIDDRYISRIDLTNNKFYYRTDAAFFGMDWTEGTALLISRKPIRIQGSFIEIADNELQNIIGGAGYSCTRLLQESDVVNCDYVGGQCGSYFEIYPERWGCESAESGSCSNSKMLRCVESPCIEDPYDPWSCTVTGEWTEYYMRACK
ncbi:MAG: cysteine peptidase family C39 domain-containing protein [Planctomycetota bacterium]|jgi:bacteriocin-like protein